MAVPTRAEALESYGVLSVELAAVRREYAVVLYSEKETKVHAFAQAQGTDKNRDHVANFNALPLTKDSMRLANEIAALEAERDFLQYAITYGYNPGPATPGVSP